MSQKLDWVNQDWKLRKKATESWNEINLQHVRKKSDSYNHLLFICGGADNIFRPSLTKTLAGKYKDKNNRVDLKIFEGKSHFICGEPGWEKVADYILDWCEKL